jgi:hypothetical protein
VLSEFEPIRLLGVRYVNHDCSYDQGSASDPSAPNSVPASPPDISWNKVTSDPRNAPDPRSVFTSEQYRPVHRNYLDLIPTCVELYYEHIYPIMPLPYMPGVRSMISRQMTSSEKNYIYSMCALTSFHMLGQSIDTPGLPSWDAPGRFFLDECISVRQSYDFLEDLSLHAVVSSFWLSTSHFEINQNRKSWLYLREALTLAHDLGLHDDTTYLGLSPEERLCRQRVFWQLFVTERSFAVLRNKPITFKKTPSIPTTRHAYEAPDIHAGFLQLINSYVPLDESFVTAWNDGSDPRVTSATYIALQALLSIPPAFLSRPSTRVSSPTSSAASNPVATTVSTEDDPDLETTAIQKADLLITQQWLRLIVWQSSFKQNLLSWSPQNSETMHFAYPLAIARRTASILQTLPSSAVEVHGMGIFEKIFEIGTWCINVLGACDSAGIAPPGIDFLGQGSDLGILGVGRRGAVVDPLEFFVKTLSASPASKTKFADRLLMFAGERPGGMKMALSPAPSSPDAWTRQMASGSGILGEVSEDGESGVKVEEDPQPPGLFEMSGALGGVPTMPLPEFEDMDMGIISDGNLLLDGADLVLPSTEFGMRMGTFSGFVAMDRGSAAHVQSFGSQGA